MIFVSYQYKVNQEYGFGNQTVNIEEPKTLEEFDILEKIIKDAFERKHKKEAAFVILFFKELVK